jgi:hypothetical protein
VGVVPLAVLALCIGAADQVGVLEVAQSEAASQTRLFQDFLYDAGLTGLYLCH